MGGNDREDGPDPIDVHVGRRVRARRQALGVSQTALADAIGVTFQQVQKYERGQNRISASKLYRIARVARTPIGYFFEGLPDPASDHDPSPADHEVVAADALFASPGGRDLAGAFVALRPAVAARLVALARAMAEDSHYRRRCP